MTISIDEVHKIAHLAKLNLSDDEASKLTEQLSGIFNFVDKINHADTTGVKALAHSQDLEQRRRTDIVTETDQRNTFQQLAPKTEAGLYLVPKVIESSKDEDA